MGHWLVAISAPEKRRLPMGMGSLLIVMLLAVAAGGCSRHDPADVMLSDLPSPGWFLTIDSAVDDNTLGVIGLDPSALGSPAPEDFWLRVWLSDRGSVVIMLGEPGGRVNLDAMSEIATTYGFTPVDSYGNDALVAEMELSDEQGSADGYLLAKEGVLAVVVFIDDISDDLVTDTISRQLAAIPDYNPLDEHRGFTIGLTAIALLIVLGIAARSTRTDRKRLRGETSR